MKKFAILGSCLSNIPGIFLANDYGWKRLNNTVLPSANHFVDYYIDKSRVMPPVEELIAELGLDRPDLPPADRQRLTEWILENYRDYVGRREIPWTEPALFQNLENETLDVILMDNLLDLRIPYWNYTGSKLSPFSFTFTIKDKLFSHLHDQFVEAPRPTAQEAADSWIRIVDYVRSLQPTAKIIFFCAPVVTNEGQPEFARLAQEFYVRFSTLARSRNIVVVPPLDIPRELTKLPVDPEHLDSAVYKAMAGYVFLSTVSISPFAPYTPLVAADRPRNAPVPPTAPQPVLSGPRRVDQSLRAIVARELGGIPPESLTEQSGVYETPLWDSLKQFAIILQVEAAFGVRFAFDETVSATTIGAIRKILARHGVYDSETDMTRLAAGEGAADTPADGGAAAALSELPPQDWMPKIIEANPDNLFGGFVQRALHRPQDRFTLLVKGRREFDLSNGHILSLAAAWSWRLAGIERGAIVAIVLDHSEHLYAAFIGCILRGVVPTFLPQLTSKQDPEIFRASMQVLFDRIRPAAVIASAASAPSIPGGYQPILLAEQTRVLPWAEVLAIPDEELCVRNSRDAVAFLQHSSGTTSHKKGVMLSHRAVLAQVAAYSASIGISPGDTIASWLPLYHDMGLITSFIVPVVMGCPIISLDAQEWVVAPTTLLDYIERERACFAWLPNFAFHHIARTDRRERSWDLTSIKAIVSCSEPCRKSAFDVFVDRYGPMGLDRTKLQVSYAMAENVFGVTQTRLGAAVRDGMPGPTASYVSCGAPIEGVEVELRDTDGKRVADGEPGEICIRSPFLFDGYFKLPEITAARLKNGWYHTGDIGVLQDGELFVIGRVDDMIIVNGRNIVAHEAEDALNAIKGISPGRNILFSRLDEAVGSDSLIVLAESKEDPSAWPAIETKVRRTLFSLCNLPVAEVHLLKPGFLVKSSSGKLARKASIDKFLRRGQPGTDDGDVASFDAASATRDDVQRLLERVAASTGTAQGLTAIAGRCAAGPLGTGAADAIAEAWWKIGTPAALLDPAVRQAIFLACSGHWKLRIICGLADDDETETAMQLAGLVGRPLSVVLRRCIDLSLARRTFRRAKTLDALDFLERATTPEDWRFLRQQVRYDVPGASLAAFSMRWSGDRLGVDDAHSAHLSTGRHFKVYPEINKQAFRDDPQAQGMLSELPLDHLFHVIEQMLDDLEYGQAMNLLRIIVDWSYLIHNEFYYRRTTAALIMRMVDAGAPVATRVLAFLLGELVEAGGWRHAGQTLLKTNVEPETEIGPQTYFLLRRAYLTSRDPVEAQMVAAKIASLLPASGPGADKHRYFAVGRTPEALTRDIGWQQERLDALVRDLDVTFRTGAARPAGQRPAKRIAVFLSGQLRSFEGVFAKIKREVIDPLQADLFIATWDSVGFSVGYHNDMARLVNPAIYQALPAELRSRDGFSQRFPQTVGILDGAKEVSAGVIRSVAGDVPCAIVDERRFEEAVLRLFPEEIVDGAIPRVRLNQFKMFFLNRLCREMLEREVARTGADYDWVIRMRPDMDAQSFIHPLLETRQPDGDRVMVHGPHPFGINDQFAYGSQRAMRHYFSCFDFLLERGGFKKFAFHRDLHGEAFLFDCLSYWGIRVAFTPALRYALSANRLSDRDFVHLMLKDCGDEDGDGIGRMLRTLVEPNTVAS